MWYALDRTLLLSLLLPEFSVRNLETLFIRAAAQEESDILSLASSTEVKADAVGGRGGGQALFPVPSCPFESRHAASRGRLIHIKVDHPLEVLKIQLPALPWPIPAVWIMTDWLV